MALRRPLTTKEWIIGLGVMFVCVVSVKFIAGALNLGIWDWILGGIAGGIGAVVWFRIIGRNSVNGDPL